MLPEKVPSVNRAHISLRTLELLIHNLPYPPFLEQKKQLCRTATLRPTLPRMKDYHFIEINFFVRDTISRDIN